jgi:ABC-type antimicrobial peptide transport system permease subunit
MVCIPDRRDDVRTTTPMCLIVRTTGQPAGLAAGIRGELRRIDSRIPVFAIDTVEEQIDKLLMQERLITTLSGFFSALAALLACLGLYGVVSQAVARRTPEMGTRLALGATPGVVLRMVLVESLTLVVAGVTIGAPLTIAATRLIALALFGVSAADPSTIGAAAVLMISVAAVAGFLPARRASRVDPAIALRYE